MSRSLRSCASNTRFVNNAVIYAQILTILLQLTPILSILLVHDLLLAKKGIALPAIHGLRTSIERHKGRLQSEFTKARIRRKLGTTEAFRAHVEEGLENDAESQDAPYPRWIRINTIKTTVEEQLETTFKDFERVTKVRGVRRKGKKLLFIDNNIPNLFAISPSVDLSKSEAYKSGAIIFQDKASCFPAYLLDPSAEDGDIIDTCSAPGNKTTHLASILLGHSTEGKECKQTIHAFEKNKIRAETLEKMVNLAGSDICTKLHPGQDFLRTDPTSAAFKKVGALLLDPSCSGSGIIGRDDMPELHLPILRHPVKIGFKNNKKKDDKAAEPAKETRKRKREDPETLEVLVDDDGEVTAVNSEQELKTRLEALSKFQLELLIHAFKFPAARRITYSTCSIHADENELVVQKALESSVAQEGGWRIQKRDEQISGMKNWPVRGSGDACEDNKEIAEACIRANKDDEHGTMGFFLAGFIRDGSAPKTSSKAVDVSQEESGKLELDIKVEIDQETPAEDDDWTGFGDEVAEEVKPAAKSAPPPSKKQKKGKGSSEKESDEKLPVANEKVQAQEAKTKVSGKAPSEKANDKGAAKENGKVPAEKTNGKAKVNGNVEAKKPNGKAAVKDNSKAPAAKELAPAPAEKEKKAFNVNKKRPMLIKQDKKRKKGKA